MRYGENPNQKAFFFPKAKNQYLTFKFMEKKLAIIIL